MAGSEINRSPERAEEKKNLFEVQEMSVKIKMKDWSKYCDRNGHTSLCSIILTGYGVSTWEHGWFGQGPVSHVYVKEDLLESHRILEKASIFSVNLCFFV